MLILLAIICKQQTVGPASVICTIPPVIQWPYAEQCASQVRIKHTLPRPSVQHMSYEQIQNISFYFQFIVLL